MLSKAKNDEMCAVGLYARRGAQIFAFLQGPLAKVRIPRITALNESIAAAVSQPNAPGRSSPSIHPSLWPSPGSCLDEANCCQQERGYVSTAGISAFAFEGNRTERVSAMSQRASIFRFTLCPINARRAIQRRRPVRPGGTFDR